MGLKLRFCNYDQWDKQLQDVMVYPGKWGSWKGMVMCPRGRYIAGARVRYEDPVGTGDDSALNGLSIWCVSKDFRYGDVEVVHNGSWGSWKPWAYRSKKFVTGAEVRCGGCTQRIVGKLEAVGVQEQEVCDGCRSSI